MVVFLMSWQFFGVLHFGDILVTPSFSCDSSLRVVFLSFILMDSYFLHSSVEFVCWVHWFCPVFPITQCFNQGQFWHNFQPPSHLCWKLLPLDYSFTTQSFSMPTTLITCLRNCTCNLNSSNLDELSYKSTLRRQSSIYLRRHSSISLRRLNLV